MGSLSIQKGKRAERDVAARLNASVQLVCARLGVEAPKVMRNLSQTQDGGFDLDGIPWLAIEVKHHKAVALNTWWAQTLRQSSETRDPVLIWKKHGGRWCVRMYARLRINPGSEASALQPGGALLVGEASPPVGKARWLRVVADIAFEDFAAWFEKRLEVELLRASDGAPRSADAGGKG
jgi:hypothetical protein